MNGVRRSLAAFAVLCLAVTGCKSEAPAPAPAAAPAPVAAKPPPPPPAAPEPRAEKECAAPLDPAPAQDLTLAGRAASLAGTRLEMKDKDADGTLVLGVLGPLNEDSGANLVAVKKYLKFFDEQKADAILVTGDVGETAAGIERALVAIAASKKPVFVVAGNRECRADYTDGVAAAQKAADTIVNLNAVRVVAFPEATLVSLPGYHDANYLGCDTGCLYQKSTVNEVISAAKEAKSPVVLISHGPPRGEGSLALDHATSGGNVGDPEIRRAIEEGGIPFGIFSNIKEAGARASDGAAGTTLVREGTASKTLFLNPGPADTMGWEMNDGTKSTGMAAVMSIKDGQASWKLYRAKPPTAAEKAQAQALEPPKRAEPTTPGAAQPAMAPKPPPGTPAKGG